MKDRPTIMFYDPPDCGCEITESERGGFAALVMGRIRELYPDAKIIRQDDYYRMQVTIDGEHDQDLSDTAQAIWEAGEFWE
jgi:hypothetical protein